MANMIQYAKEQVSRVIAQAYEQAAAAGAHNDQIVLGAGGTGFSRGGDTGQNTGGSESTDGGRLKEVATRFHCHFLFLLCNAVPMPGFVCRQRQKHSTYDCFGGNFTPCRKLCSKVFVSEQCKEFAEQCFKSNARFARM